MDASEAIVAVAKVAEYPAESARVPPSKGARIALGAIKVLARPT